VRDIFVTAVIFGALPFVLARPYIGILLWTWVSFMNPHRLCWGFAYDFPFAYIVALVTLVSLLISREPKKIPWTRETVVLLVFILWMVITTIFSVYPILAWPELNKVVKIQLMVFVTMMLMQNRERLNLLVWVMALSLAFYGVKGGIFTITHGGIYHVRGPDGTFIGGDNEMGLALIMTIPLLRYLQLTATRTWLKYAMIPAMVLCALAAIGSQSRGAMLGMAAMGIFFWLKSRGKVVTGLLTVTAAVLILMTMPQEWFDRMSTIQNYEQDASAEGRINAWKMAVNLAKDKPFGGGFETFQRGMFAAYAPDPNNVHDSHSIYFEVLAVPVPNARPDGLADGLLDHPACPRRFGEPLGRGSGGDGAGEPGRVRDRGCIPGTRQLRPLLHADRSGGAVQDRIGDQAGAWESRVGPRCHRPAGEDAAKWC
jgi:probable O-glycosylation ligase (exosortase A-associated)